MRGDAADRRRRRLVALAVVVTCALLVVDLVGGPGPGLLRRGAATVLGPLERVLAPAGRAGEDELRRDNEELQSALRQAEVAGRESAELSSLLASPSNAGARVVPARVVGVGAPGPQGVVRLTIDVGSRDGVDLDRTVVAQHDRADLLAMTEGDVVVACAVERSQPLLKSALVRTEVEDI